MSTKLPSIDTAAYDRACLLVGRFMYHWALLESALNHGIGKLLGMGSLEAAIATANMQAGAKIHIIKTLVDLKGGGAEWAKQAVKDMDAVAALATRRNTVAHVLFGPSEKGGVKLFTVKAKGKLAFPDTIWTEDDFKRHFAEARRLHDAVNAIVDRLSRKPGLLNALLTHSTAAPPETGSQNYLGQILLDAASQGIREKRVGTGDESATD